MKPNLEIIPLHDTKLLIKREYLKHMNISWHIHPEYELVFIASNGGVKHIGSHSKTMDTMELLLLGPNIPHMWYTNKIGGDSDMDFQIVIQFSRDIFGGALFQARPFDQIGSLLKKADLGISFPLENRMEMKNRMETLLTMNDFDRSIALLNLLHLLATSGGYKILSTYGFNEMLNDNGIKRIDDIYQYINTHFRTGIKLEEIAKIACMTPQAFCKYFKQKTNKTLLEFVNEMRVGHACQLLANRDFNINQVCYESGYNNLSNFNRCFRRIMKMTPAAYKKELSSNVTMHTTN
ncbi:MAG: AraC family transcriptional regulator [Alistipes sp.]